MDTSVIHTHTRARPHTHTGSGISHRHGWTGSWSAVPTEGMGMSMGLVGGEGVGGYGRNVSVVAIMRA